MTGPTVESSSDMGVADEDGGYEFPPASDPELVPAELGPDQVNPVESEEGAGTSLLPPRPQYAAAAPPAPAVIFNSVGLPYHR